MNDLSRIYIDACSFIDLAKFKAKTPLKDENESNVWFTEQLITAARDDAIKVFTSFLSIAECTHISAPGKPIPSEDTMHFYDSLLASGKSGVELVQPTFSIVLQARDLRWAGISIRGRGGADQIHLASALEMKCHEFLTSDNGILSKHEDFQKRGIRICKPKETELLPEKYRQGNLLQGTDIRKK